MRERQREYDAIVVGASIGGCRTALTLAEFGFKVLVLDERHFPRWKPCAGGVTAKTLPYIPTPLRSRFERTMKGAFLTLGPDHSTHITGSRTLGWMIHRESFDEAHMELVRATDGVSILLGTGARTLVEDESGVSVETAEGTFRAKVVVGADGVNSIVSRYVPGHDTRAIGFAFEGESTFDRAKLSEDALFDFRSFSRGYGWVFPKKDHYSVGGFIYSKKIGGVKEAYQRFFQTSPFLESCETYRTKGYRVPHGGGLRKVNTRRILLVGDAADLVDPLTGEGIYYAFRSGHLAAEVIAGLLADEGSLDPYSGIVMDEMHRDLRYSRLLASLVYSWPGLSFRLLFKNRVVCRWFTEILTGDMTYRQLFAGLLRHGWRLPFASSLRSEQVVTLD